LDLLRWYAIGLANTLVIWAQKEKPSLRSAGLSLIVNGNGPLGRARR
jgi:hypothetical protein